jgi:hypothetical protein
METRSTLAIPASISFPLAIYAALNEIIGKETASLDWFVREVADYVANGTIKANEQK